MPGNRGITEFPPARPPVAKKSPRRSAEIVAVLDQVRNQCVGDADLDGWLLGAGPETCHRLPGLIAQLAVDAALEAVEPPQLDLRLPYLIGRIGLQWLRRVGRGWLAWRGAARSTPGIFCAIWTMRPAAAAPADSPHSEIAIAAAPARQTPPPIANLFPDICVLRRNSRWRILVPIGSRSNQPFAIRACRAVKHSEIRLSAVGTCASLSEKNCPSYSCCTFSAQIRSSQSGFASRL